MTSPGRGVAPPQRLIAEPNYLTRWVILPYLYVSLLFYAVVQLQQTALGAIFVTHQHVRLIGLAGTVVASAAYTFRWTRVRIQNPKLMAIAAVYGAFVFVDFALKLLRGTDAFWAGVYGETYFYFFVFFLPLVLIVADNSYRGPTVILERGAFRGLLFVAPPIFLLGYAQVLLNAPILSLGDESQGYAVEVYMRSDIGQVRGFSVFGAAFTYGHFITLIAALAVAYLVLRRRQHRTGWVVLLIAAMCACMSTLTRNAFMEFALSIAAVMTIPVMLRRGWKNSSIIAASICVALVAYGIMLGTFVMSHLQVRGLLNLSTFGLRLVGVAAVFGKYFLGARGIAPLLLGQGYMQGEEFAHLQGIHPVMVFDNTYLDVALFSGIVGVVLFVVFFLRLFAFVLDKYRRTGAYWWLAILGMYFSYPLIALVNIYTSQLYLITCLGIAYEVLARRRVVMTGTPALATIDSNDN